MEEVFRDYGVFENANNNRIVCVNITKTYLLHQRPNLYDCTRKWWRLSGERAQNADFVFAICFLPNAAYLIQRQPKGLIPHAMCQP